ncbi:hypothetical protein SGQ44_18300 [Flavobacterium sp. Fl-77]|uniref:Uncharacterized protein n=1 Tax=Flavobacterium flavipigmentatum TaxID=2893884 RepID=A0AAJ2VY97_9FLAO|nr:MULTISPECIES: hypothetical protein [unclassified Flavobacterium]MDX6181926.1 hypothetical protein [Flavobacterium sp. Fl-33]MDX6187707.1 hypothetical protein [Flavobacterium sp. Fl-77]UFH37150.1 hypothetical protein LNP22_10430 [Flavobacterium sp. F-70]
MKKASENFDYAPLCQFLEKDGSKKALKMLEKIKEMKTNDEFIIFKIELGYKALLNAF